MTTLQQQVIAKVKECIEKGNKAFNMTLPEVGIRFDLRGRCAGTASRRGNQYYIRINNDMLVREPQEMIDNTVPHEVAHSFCQFNPRLGSHHDAGWKRVCRTLGGDDSRTHDMDVVFGKGYTYEYVTDRGHTVRMGDKHHAAVLAGRPITWRNGKGKVQNATEYKIVGYQGRTYATPIHKTVTPNTSPTRVVAVPVALPAVRPAFNPPVVRPAPVAIAATLAGATSKAGIARVLMLNGYRAGTPYETVIAQIMQATGHSKALSKATYKANCERVGIPVR